MCIHKCYNFRCGHKFFVPGAKVVCDLAMVALLTPAAGTSAKVDSESDLNNLIDQQEVANIALPQSPEPGHRNEQDLLRVGRFEIKGFSKVCKPKAHGFYSNNIERLCSDCRCERDEERELAEMRLDEAKRRASQLHTEPEGEYATDHESMLSASDVETGSLMSVRSPAGSMKSPESGAQQRKTSSGFGGLMNVFKRT